MPEKKENDIYIRDRDSKSYRLAFWSFVASLIFVFLGIIEHVQYGDFMLKFRAVEGQVVLFLLTPCLSLYGFRRYTDYLVKKGEK